MTAIISHCLTALSALNMCCTNLEIIRKYPVKPFCQGPDNLYETWIVRFKTIAFMTAIITIETASTTTATTHIKAATCAL